MPGRQPRGPDYLYLNQSVVEVTNAIERLATEQDLASKLSDRELLTLTWQAQSPRAA